MSNAGNGRALPGRPAAPGGSATPSGRGLPDQRARARIVTDLGTNLLVEAGAGSGKTTSLIGRMMALVRTGTADVRQLAAVTFTRKAAAELRERFQVALERAARSEPDPVARERLARALTGLDQAFIGTIHSFCARLLRERPVEAGLDPDFAELDEAGRGQLREAVWRQYLEHVRLHDGAMLADLEELGLSPDDLYSAFTLLADYPDVEPFRQPLPRPDVSGPVAALRAFLAEVEALLPTRRPEKGWDDLQGKLRRAMRRVAAFDIAEPRHLIAVLELLEGQIKVTQNRWGSRDDALAAKEAAERFHDAVVYPTLQAWREHRHSRIIEAVRPALERFEAERLRLGQLDFTDLLLRATALVRERAEVRRYFAARYTHLLVDEFQDTDPVQAELMVWLAAADAQAGAADGAETGAAAVPDWRRLPLRPGALFVVGDPKQSIYRFRRADIDTYNLMKEIIEASGGEVLHLTTNFRAVGSLGDWVGKVFGDILPPAATRYQAAFAPMNTVRPDPPGGPQAQHGRMSGIRYMTSPYVKYHRPGEITAMEAEWLARWIAWACQGGLQLEDEGGLRGARPGDFLVLFDKKRYMPTYARALEALGIPYTVAGAETFGESDELGELLKLLRAVADPDNPVPLVAVLRGLFFGLSDDDLYKHRKKGGRFSLLSSGAGEDGAGPAGHPAVAAALEALRRYWLWARRQPPVAAITLIIEDLGLLPFAAGGEAGHSRAGVIVQALELLRSAEPAVVATFAGAVAHLQAVYEEGGVEDQGLLPDQQQAVRLMNLHKAKGLEAPVVVLAAPVGAATHEPTMHVDRTGAEPVAHLLVQRPRGQEGWQLLAQPPGWDATALKEAQYEAAEDERLLYVAATRARDLLVIGRYADKPEISPWVRLERFYDEALELPDAAANPQPVPEVKATAADLEAAVAAAAARAKVAAVPSFGRVAVTDLVKAEGDGVQPPWIRVQAADEDSGAALAQADESAPGGTRWGNAVHRLLELAGRGAGADDLVLLAGHVLAEERLGDVDPAALLSTVQTVLQSDLWRRSEQAEERHVELPFAALFSPAHAGTGAEVAAGAADGGRDSDGTHSVPTVLRGVIDMAFREPDGWVLVDYKTDRVTDETIAAYAEHYGAQLAYYAAEWEAQTGAPVKERVLYFVSIGRTVGV